MWLRRTAELYGIGLFAGYAVFVLLHASPPSLTDYANWTYQGVLLKRHLLGLPDAAHVLKRYPVPNSAATVGIGLLAMVFRWQLAAKCWLLVQFAACVLTLRHMGRTAGAGWTMWVVAPVAIFLNLNLWYGFLNFELGLCWVLLLASLLVQAERAGRGVGVAGALVLLAAFFTHMIPLGACWLLVGCWAAQTRRWRELWHLVPTGVLAAWYVGGRYLVARDADGQAGMQAAVRDYSGAFWVFKLNSYAKSFGFVNPLGLDLWALGRGWFVLLLGADLLLAALMAWLMMKAARAAFERKSEWRFVWAAVMVMMPVFMLAPGTALGVSDPGARVLQVALALALTLSLTGKSRAQVVAAGCAGCLGLAGLVLFAREGFGGVPIAGGRTAMPQRVVEFAHIPNTDQDYFYRALDAGQMDLKVFPTGIFLNKK